MRSPTPQPLHDIDLFLHDSWPWVYICDIVHDAAYSHCIIRYQAASSPFGILDFSDTATAVWTVSRQCRGAVPARGAPPACSPVHLCAFAFDFSAAQCDCDRRFAARAGFLAPLPARAALAYILCARAAYPRRYAVFHSAFGSMHIAHRT